MCHIFKEAPPILLMFNMSSKLTLLYYYRFTKCISRTSKNIFKDVIVYSCLMYIFNEPMNNKTKMILFCWAKWLIQSFAQILFKVIYRHNLNWFKVK